jgi:uncharacterized membrane protein YkoI
MVGLAAAGLGSHSHFICRLYRGSTGNSKQEVYMTRKLVLIAVLVVVIGALSAGFAIASGSGDDQPLTGSTLDKAKAAALAHTGGGTVVETEAGDDGAAYGVEIQLADGSQVEVNLDGNFNIVGQEADDDGANDQDGSGDD